jgi:hypothetical protein
MIEFGRDVVDSSIRTRTMYGVAGRVGLIIWHAVPRWHGL